MLQDPPPTLAYLGPKITSQNMRFEEGGPYSNVETGTCGCDHSMVDQVAEPVEPAEPRPTEYVQCVSDDGGFRKIDDHLIEKVRALAENCENISHFNLQYGDIEMWKYNIISANGALIHISMFAAEFYDSCIIVRSPFFLSRGIHLSSTRQRVFKGLVTPNE